MRPRPRSTCCVFERDAPLTVLAAKGMCSVACPLRMMEVGPLPPPAAAPESCAMCHALSAADRTGPQKWGNALERRLNDTRQCVDLPHTPLVRAKRGGCLTFQRWSDLSSPRAEERDSNTGCRPPCCATAAPSACSPRTAQVYPVWRKLGLVKNFAELLHNIFYPMWVVTLDPASNPVLHALLCSVTGFDSVDNEQVPDTPLEHVTPEQWDRLENPPYAYWMYYMWANIYTLNAARHARGLNTFAFRPHCGESGSEQHLASCFLTAHSINHGINLRKSPALQYLYYVAQIGLSVSPLSNNALFLSMEQNPFPVFFRRGLNVTISTDDPLQFHLTQVSHGRWGAVCGAECQGTGLAHSMNSRKYINAHASQPIQCCFNCTWGGRQ